MAGDADSSNRRRGGQRRLPYRSLWTWGVALLALPAHHLGVRQLGAPLGGELATLPLLFHGASAWLRGRRPRLSVVDLGVAAWTLATLVAAFALLLRVPADGTVVLRQLAVAVFLAALYGAVRLSASPEALRGFPAIFVAAATIAAALGLLGFALSLAGHRTPLASSAGEVYPYLGTAARARALTSTPNMLASIVMLALLLGLYAWKPARRRWWRPTLGVLAAGFAVTFSKTILCLFAGIVVAACLRRRHADGHRRRRRLVLAGAAVVLLASLYVLSSQFVVLPSATERGPLESRVFVLGPPVASVSFGATELAVLRTSYFFIRQLTLHSIVETWPLGLGPGQPLVVPPALLGTINTEALRLSEPHSTYLGAVAEAGLAGVVGLAGFLCALGIAVVRLARSEDGLAAAALGAFVALLVEALATDVMRFPHYWWLAAVIASRESAGRSEGRR